MHFDIKTGRKCFEHEGSKPVGEKRKLKYDLVSLKGQQGKIQHSKQKLRFPYAKTTLNSSGDKNTERANIKRLAPRQ